MAPSFYTVINVQRDTHQHFNGHICGTIECIVNKYTSARYHFSAYKDVDRGVWVLYSSADEARHKEVTEPTLLRLVRGLQRHIEYEYSGGL